MICSVSNTHKVRWWLCGRLPDLQSGGCRFKSRPGLLRTKVYSACHPSGVGEWIPAVAGKAKAGMAHSDCGWTCGCAGKTEIPWEHVPYLSAFAVVFHYEEALYPVYGPLPLPLQAVSLQQSTVCSCWSASMLYILERSNRNNGHMQKMATAAIDLPLLLNISCHRQVDKAGWMSPWLAIIWRCLSPPSTSPGIAQTTVVGLADNWCHKSVEGRLAIGGQFHFSGRPHNPTSRFWSSPASVVAAESFSDRPDHCPDSVNQILQPWLPWSTRTSDTVMRATRNGVSPTTN